MSDVYVVPLFVLLFAAVGVLVYLSWLAEQKRTKALAELASRSGWHFQPGDDHSHDDEYGHFEIFRRGHSRVARNTMTGDIDTGRGRWAIRAGDFRYKVTSGSGKNRRTRTHRFSYLIVHMPWSSPPLLIRREGIFDKLLGAMGFDDIDFESEEFSRKFHVKGADKRFAYDVCHPRMIELLLQADPPVLDIEHGRCCISDGGSRWEPEKFQLWTMFARRFFELWPEHLASQLERT